VSSRTIYRHFASLDSLLLVAVAEQLQPLYRRVTEVPLTGGSPVTRVNALIRELSAVMTAYPELTLGMLRALLSGKPDVLPWVRVFRDGFETLLAITIAPNGPTPRDREAANILQNVWFSALIGFAIDTDPAGEQFTTAMRSATERVLANNQT
jgi:AcrR family transcriptional regulator